MKMALSLFAPWLAGLALGVFFFGGLWWTVRKGVRSNNPAFWFTGSLLVRMGVTMAGMYVFASGGWERLLACVAGFFIARVLVTRFAGPPLTPEYSAPEKESANES